MKDNNLPSLDDAMKSYEEINTPKEVPTETPTEVKTEVQTEKVTEVETEPTSLMELLEQEHKKALKNAPPKEADFYLKYFIGNNYESYKKGGFSYEYFLFGEYYLIYRKMYIPAIIKYLIGLVILFVALYGYGNSNNKLVIICFGIFLVFQIAPMFLVRKFYYNYAKHKVNKILSENKDKSEQEIINICSKKGGTSAIPILILIAIFFIFNRYSSLITQNITKPFQIRDLKSLSTNYLEIDNEGVSGYRTIVENECEVAISTKQIGDNQNVILQYSGKANTEKLNINGHDWYHFSDNNYDTYVTQYKDYLYTINTLDYHKKSICKKSIKILIDNLEFNN